MSTTTDTTSTTTGLPSSRRPADQAVVSFVPVVVNPFINPSFMPLDEKLAAHRLM